MYQIENSAQVFQAGRKPSLARLSRLRVSRTVLFLGLTSLFTDISSEMIATILPLYLLVNLQVTPLTFGLIDGVNAGAAALVRLAGGFWADRARQHKQVAVTGYALSASSRLLLLAVGGAWGWLLGAVAIDRLGKGIRSDPRDAMISLSSPRDSLATAFGVHRALDTAGAMIGPLIAFAVLTAAPDAYDALFVVSLCAALIGLGFLILFVDNPQAANDVSSRPRFSRHTIVHLVRLPGVGPLVLIGAVLGLATMSDGFVYLMLQRRLEFRVGLFPLLYVATALVYMLLALPAGLLADRIGRAPVFIGGYVLLLFVYGALLLPSMGTMEVVICLVLLGAYYAGTDGVLMALASVRLPGELRTSGMALVMTAVNLARLTASILFGLLWTLQGILVAVSTFAAALLAGVVLAAFLLIWRHGSRDGQLAAS